MQMDFRSGYTVLALAACSAITALASQQACADESDPKVAGTRYGQALGAIEICHTLELTDKAKTLKAGFDGNELSVFDRQATEIFDAWRKVRGCANATDPNQCKIIMDRSCVAALQEIGPNGTAISGLLELKPR